MPKETMTEVTLRTRCKWGGRYWPEGKGDVPEEALDDLRDAGVLDEPAPEPEPEPEPQTGGAAKVDAKVTVPLTDEQVALVKTTAAALTGDAVRNNGKPKAGPLNTALKAAGHQLSVSGDQINAIDFGAV